MNNNHNNKSGGSDAADDDDKTGTQKEKASYQVCSNVLVAQP